MWSDNPSSARTAAGDSSFWNLIRFSRKPTPQAQSLANASSKGRCFAGEDVATGSWPLTDEAHRPTKRGRFEHQSPSVLTTRGIAWRPTGSSDSKPDVEMLQHHKSGSRSDCSWPNIQPFAQEVRKGESVDTKPRLQDSKTSSLLRGRRFTMPFFEDDSGDEQNHSVLPSSVASLHGRPRGSTTQAKADERRKSQHLRERALKRKDTKTRTPSPCILREQVEVIDLCSPEVSTCGIDDNISVGQKDSGDQQQEGDPVTVQNSIPEQIIQPSKPNDWTNESTERLLEIQHSDFEHASGQWNDPTSNLNISLNQAPEQSPGIANMDLDWIFDNDPQMNTTTGDDHLLLPQLEPTTNRSLLITEQHVFENDQVQENLATSDETQPLYPIHNPVSGGLFGPLDGVHSSKDQKPNQRANAETTDRQEERTTWNGHNSFQVSSDNGLENCSSTMGNYSSFLATKEFRHEKRRQEKALEMLRRNERNKLPCDDNRSESSNFSTPPRPNSTDKTSISKFSSSAGSQLVNETGKRLPDNCVQSMKESRPRTTGSAEASHNHTVQHMPERDIRHNFSAQGKTHRPRWSHERRLGELLREDFYLVQWKEDGMQWQEIIRQFERISGKKRGEDTLRKRRRQVLNAIQQAKVSRKLMDKAVFGDQESIAKINLAIRERLPDAEIEAEQSTTSLNNISSPQATNRAPSYSSGFSGAPAAKRLQIPTPPSTQADTEVRSSIDHVVENNNAACETERRTEGGKYITWDIWTHMLQGNYDDPDEAEGPLEQCNLIDEEDYCHFIYRVERRECTVDELEHGIELDDVPWVQCYRTLETLAEANKLAAIQVYRTQPGKPQFADPDGDFAVTQKTDENGIKMFSLNNPGVGIVETRVQRTIRSYHEGRLPTSSEGMIRRTAYLVKWRITRLSQNDDLFGESQESIEQGNLDSVFTMVEMANQHAVQTFVDLTFKSSEVNLNVRREMKQQMIKNLLSTIQDDEQEFEKTSGQNADKTVKVWVERVPVKGPRNLF